MEEVMSYYNEKAKGYDATFNILYFRVYDAITWKYLESYVPTTPEAMVLDAGGGTGRWAVRMARKGCKVILMDTSEEMLKIAAERAKQERLQDWIVIRREDMRKTGYSDQSFDMILCEHAMFLFKEPDQPIREFARVLKKGARLIVSAQNRYVASVARMSDKPKLEDVDDALSFLLCEKRQHMTSDGKVEIFTWTPNEFRDMLERNGFCVEKIIGKGVTMPMRISKDLFTKNKYSQELFNKILEFELAVCEKPDAIALAGHMQAIAHKL
jgi:ubiquinone/menaquinone biosynthesis C-methylase UbiE